MLVYWIPETINTLPPNASHTVGVASFVLNDKGEVDFLHSSFHHYIPFLVIYCLREFDAYYYMFISEFEVV